MKLSNILHSVLQRKYRIAKKKADDAVYKLDKANHEYACAANALLEYELKMYGHSNGESTISEAKID